ncbi:MAG TPA: energy-coupling factor transporter transmembrane component T [Nitrospiria bacterium]
MISPRLKIIYLITVSVLCFVIKQPWVLTGLLAFHLSLWFAVKLPFRALTRSLRKISFFIVLILITFSLMPLEAMDSDTWKTIPILGFELSVNMTGLAFGTLMSLRVLVVVIASMAIQLSGKPGEFVEGLRAIRLPAVAAMTIDSTLHLLGPGAMKKKPGSGGGRGGASGSGQGGRGKDKEQAGPDLTWDRIKRGDFGFLIEMIERAFLRARDHLKETQPKADPKLVHDVAIISGLCLLMMTAKLMKVMPGLPFAPGHKLVILVPLYILASYLTHSRFGATITGTAVGIISFLFGEGRFGIFEILKHITPGLVVDAMQPWMARSGNRPSRLTLVGVGAACAAVRISTIVLVTLLIQAPAWFYALIVPMLISQTIFGGISGFVTFYLLKYVDRFKKLMSHAGAPSASEELGGRKGGGGNGNGRNRLSKPEPGFPEGERVGQSQSDSP